jgi:hypothetical protein
LQRLIQPAVKVLMSKPKPRPKKEDKKADIPKGKKGEQEGGKEGSSDDSKEKNKVRAVFFCWGDCGLSAGPYP